MAGYLSRLAPFVVFNVVLLGARDCAGRVLVIGSRWFGIHGIASCSHPARPHMFFRLQLGKLCDRDRASEMHYGAASPFQRCSMRDRLC